MQPTPSARLPLLGLVFAVSLLAAPACRSARPGGLEDWRACVVDGQWLKIGAEGRRDYEPRQGAHVLDLYARWDVSPIASEYTFGSLLLELPADLKVGDRITFDGAQLEGQYQEGGQIESYRSPDLRGEVEVVAVSASEVTLRLDLRAERPVIDLDHRGALPLQGTLEASRVASPQGCRD